MLARYLNTNEQADSIEDWKGAKTRERVKKNGLRKSAMW